MSRILILKMAILENFEISAPKLTASCSASELQNLNMVEREVIETSRSETPDLQSGPLPLTELPLLKLYRLSSFTSRPIQTESQCFQLPEDIILNE